MNSVQTGFFNFFNPEGSSGQSITLIGVTGQYGLAVILSMLSIGALFIFKRPYTKLGTNRYFMVSLGVFQLFLYIVYYFLHFLYLYGFNQTGVNLRGGTGIVPLHLSSITQILSGILLIKPNSKLFSLTAPGVVILVFASILIPADKSYGPQHYFYWSYYILHVIIIFTYGYLYMYGFVKYERKYLLGSFLALLIFALMALGGNGLSLVIARIPQEVTNLLFIGRDGYPLSKTLTTGNIGTNGANSSLGPLGFLPIAIFGIIFVALGHMIISKVQPYYELKNGQLVILKKQKTTGGVKDFKTMWHHFKAICD